MRSPSERTPGTMNNGRPLPAKPVGGAVGVKPAKPAKPGGLLGGAWGNLNAAVSGKGIGLHGFGNGMGRVNSDATRATGTARIQGGNGGWKTAGQLNSTFHGPGGPSGTTTPGGFIPGGKYGPGGHPSSGVRWNPESQQNEQQAANGKFYSVEDLETGPNGALNPAAGTQSWPPS